LWISSFVNRHFGRAEISGNEVIHNFEPAVNPRRMSRLVVQVFDRNSVFCCNRGFPRNEMTGPLWPGMPDRGHIFEKFPRNFQEIFNLQD
jgi:hypothetical protein